jgi:hypothetical protein
MSLVMFGFGWLTLRQAQVALDTGRLEEAQRLLSQPSIQSHRRTGELVRRLARALAERGERHLRNDDPEAGWLDLLQAEQLQTSERGTDRLRQALTSLGVSEVRALFQTGEVVRANQAIARLRERLVRQVELQVLEDATTNWLTARELAEQGEFGLALQALERIPRPLLVETPALEKLQRDFEARQAALAPLLVRLHEAAGTARWNDVLAVTEQVLVVAPQHAEARKMRSRAWKAIEPVTVAVRGVPEENEVAPSDPGSGEPQKFFLWIDGVGNFLICLGSRLVLGQAGAGQNVDIPLVADVSRLHATLSRDGEGYLLEAVRPVQVNGQPVTRVLLKANDRITLGSACQLQFRLPAPVSTSARLDLVSGHRLPLSMDGVLLMGDTLVLGAGPQVHVAIPDLTDPVVLFRHKDGLGVRHKGTLTINGQRTQEKSLLQASATVTGDSFAFAVEPAEF